MSLLWDRQPVEELLTDPSASKALRDRLKLSQDIRLFAKDTLKLPVDDAYTSYTDLKRPYAVWNIYAAPELSLEAHTWCYPVLGCLAYRGYYEESWAKEDAKVLEAEGLETRVGGVRAYSTLGYFDDPLLNSFIFTDEAYLVELLIHEISHRKLYIKDDTKFNENFATAVGQLGAELWYKKQDQEERFDTFQREKAERKKLIDFVLVFKDKLNKLYNSNELSIEQKRNQKLVLHENMRTAYQDLKSQNAWDDRYDNWIDNLNNAGLSTLSNYQDLVPGFVALFNKVGEWEVFYNEVESLSKLGKSERHRQLQILAESAKD